MSSDKEPVLIFVHIPKTGGTTFNSVLETVYGDALLNHSTTGDGILSWPQEKFAAYKAYTSHLRYGEHKRFGRPAHYVSIIRDPVDNFISFYNDISQQDGHWLYEDVKSHSIEEFFDYLVATDHPVLANRQCQHICNAPDFETARRFIEERYLLCAPLEGFDKFVDVLKRKFGWPETDYQRQNISTKKVGRDEISEEFVRSIYNRNTHDKMLHDLVSEKFADACEKLTSCNEQNIR